MIHANGGAFHLREKSFCSDKKSIKILKNPFVVKELLRFFEEVKCLSMQINSSKFCERSESLSRNGNQ